jgi:aminoglycoside phosphotransferase (APT) family kinase protein
MRSVPQIITRLKGGVVSDVYRAVLPETNVIIRLKQGYLPVYRKEKWVMEQVASAGVPVPATYGIGQQGDYSYMMVEEIKGTIGSHYQGNLVSLCCELGRLAQKVNGIAVEGFGFSLDFNPQPYFCESWLDVMVRERNFIFGDDTLIRLGALTADEWKRAQVFLEPMLDWRYPPRLSHNDISLDNTIVDEKGS